MAESAGNAGNGSAAGSLERVGFVGLGNIGEPMAKTLCGGPFELVVYDLVAAPVERLAQAGAKAAKSGRELGERCQVVGVCVVDDAATEAVVAGEDGILAGAGPGTVIVLHSTIHPATAKALAARAESQGVAVVDAQMTGGAALAATGELRFMVGGDESALARCRPMLETMGAEITQCGGIGMGAVAKLCNNLAQFVAWVGITEAARLADHAGLERDQLVEVLSWLMNDNARAFLASRTVLEQEPDHGPLLAALGAGMKLAEKDLSLALTVAGDVGVTLPGTELTREELGHLFAIPDPKRS